MQHDIDALIRRHHPDVGRKRLTQLDFATETIVAPPEFADRTLALSDPAAAPPGTSAMAIPAAPADFLARRFDVVITSIFTRLPDPVWAEWLYALYYHLERNGLLIFETNGRAAHAQHGGRRLETAGFLFTEPATMIATQAYVIDRIDECANAELVAFTAGSMPASRDLWIVRKTGTAFTRRALPDVQGLRAQIEALEASRALLRGSLSWRITAPLRAIGRLRRR